MSSFYDVLGRITWAFIRLLVRRQVAAVPVRNKLGAAALVAGVLGLAVYVATREDEED